MSQSTRFFAPLLVLMVVLLSLQWTLSTQADAVAPEADAAGVVTPSPFEYFPHQFSMDGAEAGEPVPTF